MKVTEINRADKQKTFLLLDRIARNILIKKSWEKKQNLIFVQNKIIICALKSTVGCLDERSLLGRNSVKNDNQTKPICSEIICVV